MMLNRRFLVSTLALWALVTGTAIAQEDMTLRDVWQRYRSSLVRIVVTGANVSGEPVSALKGTGLIVRASGKIVTALHVVRHASEWQRDPDGRPVRNIFVFRQNEHGVEEPLGAASVDEIPEYDIAFLNINAFNFPNIEVDQQGPQPFDRVFVLPWDPDVAVAKPLEAQLTNPNPAAFGDKLILFMPVIPGNSGAPIFGKNGKLIGVITNSLDNDRALAVPGYLFASRLPAFRPTDEDPPALHKESTATRLRGFTFMTPPGEFKAGMRRWKRVADDRWEEIYPDGTKQVSNILKRTNVGGCDGAIISGRLEPNFQVFLPDKGCPDMRFLFRRLPSRSWVAYVPLENIQ